MKHISFIIIILLFASSVQGQNNSIKGIIWGLGEPIFTFGAWQGALSYEYSLTKNHSLVLDGSTIFASGYSEDCTPYVITSVRSKIYFTESQYCIRFDNENQEVITGYIK